MRKLKKFVWEQVTPLLTPLFIGITSLDVLDWMSHCTNTYDLPEDEPDEKESKARRIAYYRQYLAFAFILDDLDEDDMTEGDIIAETAGAICNKARTAGIVFPKGWAESWVTSEILESVEVEEVAA